MSDLTLTRRDTFQLRWLLKPNQILQYRTREPAHVAGIFVEHPGRWSEWKDVPVQRPDEEDIYDAV